MSFVLALQICNWVIFSRKNLHLADFFLPKRALSWNDFWGENYPNDLNLQNRDDNQFLGAKI